MSARVHVEAGVVEHVAVAAAASGYEDYNVVLGGEGLYAGQSVGHLSANGVEVLKVGRGLDGLGDAVDDLVESVEGHGGLGEEENVAFEIERGGFLGRLHNDGLPTGLSDESDDFCVSGFAVDYDLSVGVLLVDGFDAPLELEYDGAGGIN